MDGDIAIRVDGVSKDFILPHEKSHTLKAKFTTLFKGRKGKTSEVQHALKNISFEVKKGEFFGIVGRNGSGKSTLLKIIAQIYQPTKGSVAVHGKLVPFIELGVGFNPELTGRENVYLNGAMLGFSDAQIDEMYDDIVAFAELERFMDQKLKNYSSGMQVRLAFSLATRVDADILLVDEVLAVGDADFQRKCYAYFKDLKKNNKTVIFVSHDMNAVREYCDRAILIEKSKLIEQGGSEKVASAYTRMFTDSVKDERNATRADSKRGGDGSVKYVALDIAPHNVTNEKEIIISTRLKSRIDSHEVIAGFSISDATGLTILGTNTKIKNIKVGPISSGEEVEIVWKVPNIFGDGKYYLGLAVTHSDGVKIYDWWDDALSFNVLKDEKTPYIVSPDINVSVGKSGDKRR